LGALPQKRL